MEGMPFLALFIAVLLRWCVSLHPYSGEGHPPMFGDYEAQRHWMELTRNLPLKDWYYNTSQNDLMYWGLDYPPLTAYHSFLCGHAAEFVNPEFVALDSSRGYESYEHKFFMRITVLLADIFIYMPAIWWFFGKTSSSPQSRNKHFREGDTTTQVASEQGDFTSSMLPIFLTLIYPGQIIIDHGHFQYNGISLGLSIAAIGAIIKGRDFLASILFCLSINYKQMGLYHAFPFFFYLLGTCLPKHNIRITDGFVKLLLLGSVVIFTFLVVWFPFLKNIDLTLQVLHRLFPFARGVFEDKVSNVWCSLNVVYKFKTVFNTAQMAKVCLAATLVAVLPSCLDIFVRPRVNKFLIAVINSSLAFFLFSFQVHEKSILLAAVPVALHLPSDPLPCFWFLLISTFSMLPLLLKDDLLIAYIALTVFYFISVILTINVGLKELVNNFVQFTPSRNRTALQSKSKKPTKKSLETKSQSSLLPRKLVPVLFLFSLAGSVVLTFCSVMVRPPARYPDLFPLLVSVYSCVHFISFFVYFNYVQIFTLDSNTKLKSNG
ncbi:dolichyl pyrophosphate Man9GlcNAc2 alpha-1,3-glucosyltransferase [Periplaneta americana]|uniref:dolichyl pyrophosphate Man9GlcNAc2 alpha-1,3-glucosyltransferase n=1 Tax=Periplaneta americana TaxID=6978 RepID=UPI0037E9792A